MEAGAARMMVLIAESAPFHTFVLGLGLFFLGLNLVGENLKLVASGRVRETVARTTRRRCAPAVFGLGAGALMQSATAVTFIGVSMVAAGLLTATAAAGLIVWSNVGLTALAFIATLDIDPTIALIVGASGIALGIIRIRVWQTLASVLLGMGLILMGLHLMAAGAHPLGEQHWFHRGISIATSFPLMAFLAGALTAGILQSNTGATMMIITLAAAGAIDFHSAALMIYGTNLGAIPLRIFLSTGLRGQSFRLVRMEDLFCLLSGVVMLSLYALEAAGIPLVFALVTAIATTEPTRLALIFLLSNLVPAVLLTPLLPSCLKLLAAVFPSEAVAEGDGHPKFLATHALNDPPTALALLRKELGRLVGLITLSPIPPATTGENEDGPPQDFVRLASAIQDFAVKLASHSSLGERETATLHKLRAILSGIRHTEEASRFYIIRAREPGAIKPIAREQLEHSLTALLGELRTALDQADLQLAQALQERTRSGGDFLAGVRRTCLPSPANLEAAALAEDCRLLVWTFHRLCKLLVGLLQE